MKIVNTDQKRLKEILQSDKEVVYASLVPYKNNTCIKVYDEEGNPLGDIPQEEISSYINKDSAILFVKEYIDDDTGLPVYTLETII